MGKFFYVAVSSGSASTPTGVNLTPTFFGARATAYATLFAKWRVNRMIVRFINSQALGSGTIYVAAFLDDSVTSANIPTTLNGLIEQRCSQVNSGGVDSSTGELSYSPPRGNPRWFFTTLEASTSDPRLEVPGSFYVSSTATSQTMNFLIDFDLTFTGAVDTGSS
jgi:hypothetical protein